MNINFLNNEKEIISRLSNSDREAFELVYNQYSEAIYNFIFRKVVDSELSNDLTQEVFVNIWLKRKNLDPNKNIKPYLYTAANNKVIDYYRKKKLLQLNESDLVENFVYEKLDKFDIDKHIKDGLMQLSTMQRSVLLLAKFEGLKYKEIAEFLNISVNTVENHMSQALKKLRAILRYLSTFMLFIIKHIADKFISLVL